MDDEQFHALVVRLQERRNDADAAPSRAGPTIDELRNMTAEQLAAVKCQLRDETQRAGKTAEPRRDPGAATCPAQPWASHCDPSAVNGVDFMPILALPSVM